MNHRDKYSVFERRIRRHPTRTRVMCFGDSWFQMPGYGRGSTDIHKQLAKSLRSSALFMGEGQAARDRRGFAIGGRRIAPHLESYNFDLLLLSHGGNDVIGREFAGLVKRKHDPQDTTDVMWQRVPGPVRDHIKLADFHNRLLSIRCDYVNMIGLRDRHRPECPIVLHTYAYIFPGNRPFKFGRFPTGNGPWVWNYLCEVGLKDLSQQRIITNWMLLQFFKMLDDIRRSPDHNDVYLIDSRRALDDDKAFKRLWADEIHPSPTGVDILVSDFWVPALNRLGLR